MSVRSTLNGPICDQKLSKVSRTAPKTQNGRILEGLTSFRSLPDRKSDSLTILSEQFDAHVFLVLLQ